MISLPFTVATTSAPGARWHPHRTHPGITTSKVPRARIKTATRACARKNDSTCNLISPRKPNGPRHSRITPHPERTVGQSPYSTGQRVKRLLRPMLLPGRLLRRSGGSRLTRNGRDGRGVLRRRGLFACGAQRAVDHDPYLLAGHCAVDALAIDELCGGAVDSERVGFFRRGFDAGL